LSSLQITKTNQRISTATSATIEIVLGDIGCYEEILKHPIQLKGILF
jgi:hypothetical protein